MSKLFDKTTQSLGASLNFRQLRHSITSGNVANAETPGYKAKKIDFEKNLRRALDTDGMRKMEVSDPDHFPIGQGGMSDVRVDIFDNPEGNVSNDGNTVDMEREMAKMADNNILYKAALRLINKKLAAMRYVATEGSR